jgi:CBS domain-containing protein
MLMEAHPAFMEYFFKSFLNKYIDKTYKASIDRNLLQSGGDRLLFTTPVGEISTRSVITAPQTVAIREAARTMVENKVSSLVLVDETDYPVGIVTDKDLRNKVVAKNRDVNDCVSSIMSSTLIKTDATDFCFESLVTMIRHNIHHLVVVDKGRIGGIITNHDLMLLQGTSPISMVREIDGQNSIEGLAQVARRMQRIIGMHLKEGAKAESIMRVATEIHGRIVRKVLTIAERKFGRAPVRYCWIGMGSEGRKEQIFRTDQDNGIIHADPDSEDQRLASLQYFERFADFVNGSLEICGFQRCPARVMANNPMWRQPLGTWKRYFQKWINEPTAESVRRSQIFFDFRALHGDQSLADELRSYSTHLLTDNRLFWSTMANVVVHNPPPIGFFKNFVVEKGGHHRNELNLKIKGTALFVDILRLFSLEKGVTETSTIERIEALRGRHDLIAELAEELHHAFDYVMFLMIQHQFRQTVENKPIDHFLDPDTLSKVEKKMLKESFDLVEKLQDFVIDRYRTSIV